MSTMHYRIISSVKEYGDLSFRTFYVFDCYVS